jgi:hypothetical protein
MLRTVFASVFIVLGTSIVFPQQPTSKPILHMQFFRAKSEFERQLSKSFFDSQQKLAVVVDSARPPGRFARSGQTIEAFAMPEYIREFFVCDRARNDDRGDSVMARPVQLVYWRFR